VATYCFVSSFRKTKFCGVSSRTVVNVGCAVGKKSLRNNAINILSTDREMARHYYPLTRHNYTCQTATTNSKSWCEETNVCAVQLKRRLVLHRNGSKMLKGTCSHTTACPAPHLWTGIELMLLYLWTCIGKTSSAWRRVMQFQPGGRKRQLRWTLSLNAVYNFVRLLMIRQALSQILLDGISSHFCRTI
jgi:hypothetical protein